MRKFENPFIKYVDIFFGPACYVYRIQSHLHYYQMVPHHVHGEVKGTLLSATGSDSEPGKFKLLGSDFEASFLQVLL